MEPAILYEDKDIVAINKPSGLVVHSDGKTDEPNLVEWLLRKYPEMKDVGEPGKDSHGKEILRSGIVHRLDRGTSGVMLAARTQKAFEHLKKQFQAHEIIKKYEAFIFGEMKLDGGTIDRPIGRSPSDFRRWSAQRGARGEMREAVTEYEVVLRGGGYSLIQAMPKTGRTHQIRVHLKAIDHPLVGDSLYAPGKANTLGFARQALHSSEVTFKDIKGEPHTVTAPEPEDFISAKAVLQTL